MSKIRVHELAKELGKQNKDILNFLAEKGIEVKSHMSSIENEQIELVKKKFGKAEKEEETVKAEGTASAPKKKNITQVFHPQNSRTGIGRTGQRPRQGERPQGRGARPQDGQAARTVKTQDGLGAKMPIKDVQGARLQEPQNKPEEKAQELQNKPVVSLQESQGKPMGKLQEPQNKPIVKSQETQGGQGARAQASQNRQEARTQESQNRQGMRTQEPQNRQGTKPQESQNRQGTRKQEFQGRSQARPQGSRSQGDRLQGGRFQGDRSQGNRFQGDRPQGGRSQGDRPQGGRPQGDRLQGGRFQGDRPQGGRPQGDRSQGNRFQGDRPQGSRSQGGRGQGSRSQGSAQAPLEMKPLTKESRTRNDKAKERVDKFDRFEKGGRSQGGNRPNQRNNNGRNGKNNVKPPVKAAPQEKKADEIKTIILPESLTIGELAEKMKIPASTIIKKLFLEGIMVTVNHEIDYDKAEEIALEYNCIAEMEEKVDVIEELLREDEEDEAKMVSRPPVVCVMGHVDHGKTSLLDAIRNTHVIAKEAGGITQHIGAYVVSVNGQKITFLDTPGHEAFTAMRMRGANATDIAILVVAADDGVMPQTVEAINHAKAAGTEIIVAINKIDKPSANIERVKQELAEHELVPEDWGGSTIFVPVSAHTQEGIDSLLEMILLTAEVSELKANPKRAARGLIIEAELDKGKGPVATVLVQKGTLRIGDPVAAGSCYGKVRAMMDDKGRRVKEAGPSTPVEILGLSDVPNAGEIFVAMPNEKEARSFAETFISQGREKLLEETKSKSLSLNDIFNQIKEGSLKELGLIVKADVQGSVEAVKQSLLKLSNEEVVVKIIHGGVGAINESDVSLASASNAIIIGFNVRPDATAKATAEREGVDVRLYRVIYDAIADVERAMKGMLDPVFEEKIIGHAEVRQLFKSSGVGMIAGSYVLDGVFQRGCSVRISREGKQIYEGSLASLKRFKDDVKEVRSGYECGLVFEKFSDLKELDQVEAYIMVEVPR
ncbi:translation initiation factor IF-2 [Hominisplanchenecus murintestinalis]|uniref:Translation initiation factor IF-2 n=1 Tax=Hominisplanchenecus murintestinalis TaxID=2941517 RepID=A0AC61R3E0_9FIRM|nr:translation initiation factor IF-2 [Hominisplanchenecus murintestinalis]NBH97492.1 translation initiation factor IF-2 [Lachnospiraceae bacterium]NBI74564.1 translation initiation factor IF-2 [Lachnospiraceae bacterium]RKJ97652.1 translation initiation factor IF-2 [Anaerotruncus sp. 1XD22-93]TGY00648.1 translation initiation factor IF-2 [Hominisplanchenecus murintestinalis]